VAEGFSLILSELGDNLIAGSQGVGTANDTPFNVWSRNSPVTENQFLPFEPGTDANPGCITAGRSRRFQICRSPRAGWRRRELSLRIRSSQR